ncbi:MULTISPECIES: hypothetical protein [Paraburkholderia]|nr:MULTISPECIES: hypothetical protein [Paraburkholderia]MCX4139387.1 hypothetical protein [Paraburkholderia aspalathi]
MTHIAPAHFLEKSVNMALVGCGAFVNLKTGQLRPLPVANGSE